MKEGRSFWALLTRPSIRVFRFPGIAMSQYGRLERRTSLKVFAVWVQPSAASKVREFLQSGRFACSWDLRVNLSNICQLQKGASSCVSFYLEIVKFSELMFFSDPVDFESLQMSLDGHANYLQFEERTFLKVSWFREQPTSSKMSSLLAPACCWDLCVQLPVATGTFSQVKFLCARCRRCLLENRKFAESLHWRVFEWRRGFAD